MAMGTLQLGDRAPTFNLPSVDGRTYSLDSFASTPVLVVIFSCNHCPYVQAYEDRRQLAGPVGRVAPLSEGSPGCPLTRLRADRSQDPRDRLYDQMGPLSQLAPHKTAVLLSLLLVSASAAAQP